MEDFKLYTYRYMWTLKGNNEKCFVRIITDVPDGLIRFQEDLKKNTPELENFGREYVCEYDTSKFGLFEDLLKL